MGQTELTVFLTLAATFGQTGFLVGYQVSSSEHPFCLVRYLQESQRLFQVADIGIDGAAVNTQVACSLLYWICLFRNNFHYFSCWLIFSFIGCRKGKQLIISCQCVKYGIISEIVGIRWIMCYHHIQYGWTKAVDGKSIFTEIRKAYIWWLTALTANPMKIRHKVSLGNCCNTTYYILSDFSYKE